MKLIAKEPGLWETEDGRARIILDDTFESECDVEHSHPVRMRRDQFDRYPDWMKDKTMGVLFGGREHGRYVSWLCPGGEIHNYSQWTVQVDGEWTEDVYDTFRQARAALEAIIGKVTLSRLRRERATPSQFLIGDTPHFEYCGHRVEYDIDGNCYECHLDPRA